MQGQQGEPAAGDQRGPSEAEFHQSGSQWSHQPVAQNGQGPIETGLQLLVLPQHLPDQVAADRLTLGVSLDE